MISGVGAGVGYFREGFRLIRQPGLRGLVVIPILINVLLFGLFAYLLGSYFSGWVDWTLAQLPDWLSFLAWLLWLLFAVLFLLVMVYGFVFAANLIGSPFYGVLAERVEERLTGRTVAAPLTWQGALWLVPKALLRELHKLLYYLPRILAILLLGFVPLVQAGAPVFSLAFSAWMMAIQFIDYPADNQGVTFPHLRRTLTHRRLTCLGFGGCVLVGSLIPILNLFVMPAAVAGGTALWVRELQPALARRANQAPQRNLAPSTKK